MENFQISNSSFQFQLLANAEFVGYKNPTIPKASEASQWANLEEGKEFFIPEEFTA